MKRFVTIAIFWIMSVFAEGWLPVSAELVDKIVATLNDELILFSEMQDVIQRPAAQMIANLRIAADQEHIALTYLIERQLLMQEVGYLAFPKDSERVKTLALQYVINAYHDKDAKEFESQLQEAGIADTALEQELMIYMKGMDYIRRKHRFGSDIDNPELVLNLFRQWLDALKAAAKIETDF